MLPICKAMSGAVIATVLVLIGTSKSLWGAPTSTATTRMKEIEFRSRIDRLQQVSDIRLVEAFRRVDCFVPGSLDELEVEAGNEDFELVCNLIAQGADGLPLLCSGLDDVRPTRLPEFILDDEIGSMSIDDSIDENRRCSHMRIPSLIPAARNFWGERIIERPSRYRVTAGDLCAYLIGQIVNRNYIPARYQPTGCVVILPVSATKELHQTLRSEYETWNKARHLSALLRDIESPDHSDRRQGAFARLQQYFPQQVDPTIRRMLTWPTYDAWHCARFLDELQDISGAEERRARLLRFRKEAGDSAFYGVCTIVSGMTFHEWNRKELFTKEEIDDCERRHFIGVDDMFYNAAQTSSPAIKGELTRRCEALLIGDALSAEVSTCCAITVLWDMHRCPPESLRPLLLSRKQVTSGAERVAFFREALKSAGQRQ